MIKAMHNKVALGGEIEEIVGGFAVIALGLFNFKGVPKETLIKAVDFGARSREEIEKEQGEWMTNLIFECFEMEGDLDD